MVSKKLRETVAKIRSLKIQGASKVRAAVVNAVKYEAKHSKAKTVSAFRKEIRAGMALLLSARPTEPETRTAVRILLTKLNYKTKNVKELKKVLIKACVNYEKDRKKAMRKIAEQGAKLIRKNSVVFTHCHSHTVIEILKKARRKIKYVIFTETRPFRQGHLTAKDLSNAKIKGVMVVDSAAFSFMKKANVFLTGCDSILADGSIVNKIGTQQISLAAKQFGVPHIVVGSSHKFAPLTYYGQREKIEERSVGEVWGRKLKGIEIRNPAFDVTNAKYVSKIVTELGVFLPKVFAGKMKKQLKLKKHRAGDFDLKYLLKST